MAKAKRKTIKMPKKTTAKLLSREFNGWMSPGGYLIHCKYCEHQGLAYHLAGSKAPDYGKSLEKKGWVKLQKGEWHWDYNKPRMPRPRQKNAIAEWCTDHRHKLPIIMQMEMED